MNETVGVAELKARLSEHLRHVKAGNEVTILDRGTPIARIVPINQSGALRVRPPKGEMRFQDVPLPDVRVDLGFDIVDLIVEERNRDR